MKQSANQRALKLDYQLLMESSPSVFDRQYPMAFRVKQKMDLQTFQRIAEDPEYFGQMERDREFMEAMTHPSERRKFYS
jgi:hypothetical protein